jgi:thioredoxin-related protein
LAQSDNWKEFKMRKLLTLITLAVFALPAFAGEIGDDGLHKTDWMRDTFKDLQEDLAEANDEGKRLMVIIEQRGCIYCQLFRGSDQYVRRCRGHRL